MLRVFHFHHQPRSVRTAALKDNQGTVGELNHACPAGKPRRLQHAARTHARVYLTKSNMWGTYLHACCPVPTAPCVGSPGNRTGCRSSSHFSRPARAKSNVSPCARDRVRTRPVDRSKAARARVTQVRYIMHRHQSRDSLRVFFTCT